MSGNKNSGRKKGYKHLDKIKLKISNSSKGKVGLWNKGKGHIKSEETKDKIRESCRNCPVVHHINGNHFDDRPENRIILTPREHAQIHLLQGDIKPYGR
jgi:hypothetical protein